jgi:hypothetical protein
VSIDEQPLALPKLYGAPAYARPRASVVPAPRPFDPDQLPLEVYQTDEDARFADHLRAHVYASAGEQGALSGPADGDAPGRLRPRGFRLGEIVGRILGGR